MRSHPIVAKLWRERFATMAFVQKLTRFMYPSAGTATDTGGFALEYNGQWSRCGRACAFISL